MDVTAAGGYHRFTLTHELELKRNIWLGFIEEVKRMVPAEARSYDKETYEWTIEDTWWPTVRALKDKHFTDPNQLSLLDT
jgi:hypothetical protein